MGFVACCRGLIARKSALRLSQEPSATHKDNSRKIFQNLIIATPAPLRFHGLTWGLVSATQTDDHLCATE